MRRVLVFPLNNPRALCRPLFMLRHPARWAALAVVLLASLLSAVACRRTQEPKVPQQPALRLYVSSTLAGAIEPCGCRKDMLGGVDHAAAIMAQGRAEAPHQLFVGAGPMLFINPELTAERKAQDLWKAESLVSAFKQTDLRAWAPGANDFAAGTERLGQLAAASGAQLLAGNLVPAGKDAPLPGTRLVDVDGLKVGLAGVSLPKYKGFMPPGLKAEPLEPALRAALAQLQAQGAKLRVALVAAPRGEALRLAERVAGFHVFVVGKPSDAGEGNDAPTPPVLVNGTLVVQGPNHLQGLGVVDLYVRDDSFDFADGTGIAVQEIRDSLQHRIAELSGRLSRWRQDTSLRSDDLKAREAELQRLQKELGALAKVEIPKRGSFFKYQLVEVREGAGEDPRVHDDLRAYYRKVNDHNKEQFKERKPKPAPKGQAHYSGLKACVECHEEAYAFWKTTGHAKAYATLADDFKEFNLDCVSCHVTGYEQPGGSTVTFVDGLKDVQCESCHGPGSSHAAEEDSDLITLRPDTNVCKKCHHAPHVADDWSAKEAWTHIVGPGHGADSKPPAQ